jgi:hypothetical protein
MAIQEITYDESYLSALEAEDAPDTTDTFDPDADYNRPAPPIEDGWYQAVLSNAGVFADNKRVPYRSAQWRNQTRPHFEIAVKGEIQKPEDTLVDKRFVFTGMPLTTTPDPERHNASAVGAAFKAITGKPIAGLPGLSHVKQLDEALQSTPLAWVRIQNVLQDDEAAKAYREREKADTLIAGEEKVKAVYGQKKIAALPGGTDAVGKFTGAADHPVTGTRCASRPQIVEFKPADWVPPVRK